MIIKKIENEYIDWMARLVDIDSHGSYRKIFSLLYNRDFQSVIPLDQNRVEDGIDLRYRFGYDTGWPQYIIANELDTTPCSTLEVMVALANRCEESIMTNPELGDRTGEWFWEMLSSLGLSRMDDSHFDEKKADDILQKLFTNTYAYDGKGGLFTVNNPPHDMRSVEIWSQMCFYLAER